MLPGDSFPKRAFKRKAVLGGTAALLAIGAPVTADAASQSAPSQAGAPAAQTAPAATPDDDVVAAGDQADD
jgi:hypothetical protein